MPELFTKPPAFRPGMEGIPADYLNKILAAIPRTLTGNGVDVKRYGDRFVIENDPDFVQPGDNLNTFVVLAEYADCLLCIDFNFTIEQQDYQADLGATLVNGGLNGYLCYVAKPYDLQQSVFENQIVNGNLITFSGVGQRVYGGNPEQLTPNYYPGSIITAFSGQTGLYSTSSPVQAWTAGTYGYTGVTTYNDETWICVDYYGTSSTPGTDDTWDIVDADIGTWILQPYQYAALVSYGAQYISITAGNVGNPLTNLTNWIPLPQPSIWSSLATYVANQTVTQAGISYVCILGNTNETPPNATYWATLTDQGAYNPATTYSVGQYSESTILKIWLNGNIDGTSGLPGLSPDWLDVTSNFGQTIPIVWTDINADGRHWAQPDVGIAYIVTGDLVNGKYDGLADRRNQEWFTEVAMYASGVTYSLDAITTDSGGNYYQSLQNGNIGNTPSSSTMWWELLAPLSPVWVLDLSGSASLTAESRYDAVIEPPEAGGYAFISITNNNQGNLPTDTANWLQIINNLTIAAIAAGAIPTWATVLVTTAVIAIGDQTLTEQLLDFPANLNVTITDAAVSITSGTVTINGQGADGGFLTESINIGDGGTAIYTSTNQYVYIYNINVNGLVGNTGSDTIEVEIAFYPQGCLRAYSGHVYVANTDALASEVPGVSVDWTEVTLSSEGVYSTVVSYNIGDFVQIARPLFVINSTQLGIGFAGQDINISTVAAEYDTTGNTIYSPGDVVAYMSGTYKCSVYSPDSTPGGNPYEWTPINGGLILNVPDANPGIRGVVSLYAQEFIGLKTFVNTVTLYGQSGYDANGDPINSGNSVFLQGSDGDTGTAISMSLSGVITPAGNTNTFTNGPAGDPGWNSWSLEDFGPYSLVVLNGMQFAAQGGPAFELIEGTGFPGTNNTSDALPTGMNTGIAFAINGQRGLNYDDGSGFGFVGGIYVFTGQAGGPTTNNPVVNPNVGNVATSVTTLAVTGMFLTGLTSSGIVLSSGTATVSSVTNTGFTLTFTSPPSYGPLLIDAIIGGLTSGFTQIATVTGGTALPIPVLNTSLQAIAVNAPSFLITGGNFDTTASDDSITSADALGWSGAFEASSPAPTSTTATIDLSGTISPGAAYAFITVNGVISGLPVQVAQFVPAPTLNINTQAISTSTTSFPITGTGFATVMTIALSSGTATVTYLTPTTATVNVTSAPSTGTLNGTVTANGGASSTVQVADVTTGTPGPDVTMMTTGIAANATTLTIYGNYFDPSGTNTVALSGGATATVGTVTTYSIQLTSITGLIPGSLTVIVTTDSVSSGAPVQIATVVAGPAIATFDGTSLPNNGNLSLNDYSFSNNALIWYIRGTGFSTTPSNNIVALSSGTATVIAATSSLLTIEIPYANQPSTGSLTATVTVSGQASASVQIATVVHITITPNTAYITTAATAIAIAGSNIPSATSAGIGQNNLVALTAFGSVTWQNMAGTAAVITFPGTFSLVAGNLYATLADDSDNGVSTAIQIATVVAATSPPTVTLNTSNVTQATGSFTFDGTNFSTTTAQDTVTFSSGTWAITSATATSITVNFSVAPSLGSLTAIVVTAGGGSSGAAVQVATIVSAAVVWTMEYGTIAGNTPPATFTPSSSNIGTTSTGGAIVGAGATALAYTDLGTTANTINVAFTFVASENTSANGGPGAGLRWDNVGDSGVYAFVRNIGGSGPILAFFEASAGWSSVQGNTTSLTLTNGTTYTITLVDNGTSVIASLIDDVGTQSMTFSTTLNASKTKVAFGFLSQAGFSFTATDITGVTT